jgi:PAS domain S-box-containing protein
MRSVPRPTAESTQDPRAQMQAVLDGADDAIFLKNRAGQYLLANLACCQAIGSSREQILGHDDRDLFPPETAARIQAHDAVVMEAGETRRFQLSVKRQTGVMTTYLTTKSPYRDSAGHVIGVIGISRDVTAYEALITDSSYLAAIVRSSDDAIVSKTLDGVITSWNPGAERIFGFTANEAIGNHITLIIPPERWSEEDEVLARIRRGEGVDHFDTVRIRKDGTLVNISLTVSPVRNEAGVIIGVSKIARDISLTKRLERERSDLLAREQHARSEAEAANRAKDEFLATVSHELRTPLSAILGWAQVIRLKSDSETLEQAFKSIERNARHQVQLIEDLLDLSRITAGKMHLEIQPVDLGPVIVSALETVRPAAEAKAIRLGSRIQPGATVIMGDPGRLQQICWNLLSNAVKFTPCHGAVTVAVDRAHSTASIRVSDDGQGIEPDALPYIFERFHRADPSLTRTHGGLGLGLAIVRHLVELQGGSVTAESPGKGLGATFTVTLPLPPSGIGDRPETVRSMALPLTAPRCDGITVLVVDDEMDSRLLLGSFLESYGATVAAVDTVRAALDSLDRQSFDAVVSDLAMPGTDGFALARQIRARPVEPGGRISLIALTSHAGARTRIEALGAGFDAYVTKPVDPGELAAVVANLAHRSRSR